MSGSAFVPSSVTTFPFTFTCPLLISSSALRREAIPAAAIIFCRRSAGMNDFQVLGWTTTVRATVEERRLSAAHNVTSLAIYPRVTSLDTLHTSKSVRIRFRSRGLLFLRDRFRNLFLVLRIALRTRWQLATGHWQLLCHQLTLERFRHQLFKLFHARQLAHILQTKPHEKFFGRLIK